MNFASDYEVLKDFRIGVNGYIFQQFTDDNFQEERCTAPNQGPWYWPGVMSFMELKQSAILLSLQYLF